jgi:hypothetical protein
MNLAAWLVLWTFIVTSLVASASLSSLALDTASS